MGALHRLQDLIGFRDVTPNNGESNGKEHEKLNGKLSGSWIPCMLIVNGTSKLCTVKKCVNQVRLIPRTEFPKGRYSLTLSCGR